MLPLRVVHGPQSVFEAAAVHRCGCLCKRAVSAGLGISSVLVLPKDDLDDDLKQRSRSFRSWFSAGGTESRNPGSKNKSYCRPLAALK